jgi:hypothetical protein
MASGLVGPSGAPISSSDFRKAPPPKLGEKFGVWAGQEQFVQSFPGAGLFQFDLSKLTLQDFEMMRDHYQVNASLSVLGFMVHQLEWHVECEDQRIADECESQLREIWTRLIRGISQAFWSGYSPMVLQWDNNIDNRTIELTKVKDLRPDQCMVNWKEVDGYAPPGKVAPKLKVYDGINQFGQHNPIPVENSLWYPLLMENGDYYGRKLLRSAFPSWFFSILIHLFANRYFERFGEPLPIGRADFDADVNVGNETISGHDAMQRILLNLRNRGVVTLPADRDPTTKEYLFDLEYLESQMRGADFERYLQRLDEEMSLALFTPLLLLRTADVGSYNLGVGHMQMYLWMLNAVAGDIKEYIDRYVLERIKAVNFSPRAPKVKWVPLKMGKQNVETLRGIVTELVRQQSVKFDLTEVGQALGLTLTEVQQIQEPDEGDPDDRQGRPERPARESPRGTGEARDSTKAISARIGDQVAKAFSKNTFGTPKFSPKLGYRTAFEKELEAQGVADPAGSAESFYERAQAWLDDAVGLGTDAYPSPEEFSVALESVLAYELNRILDA